LASIVVFLVALPLSLGIALASGAPVIAGLIAAACGGIVVGLLGGAPLQVSGPAAGLTIIVAGIVAKFGWPTTCLIVLIAGLIQLALGYLRIARAALAITPAVVHGMLAGIGLTIAIAQLCVVFGAPKPPSPGAFGNLQALPSLVSNTHVPSILLGGLALGILFLWPKMPKKVQAVPGPLVAVLLPTVISVAGNFTMERVNLPDKLTEGFLFPSLPADSSLWGGILIAAATIALVASVESLLSAVATDKMHDAPRADLDRELIGQGAANAISGALGGLPVTGVIVRSSANIRSGATTKRSAILHGVWIVLFVALFSPHIERIPLAVLAGLLVHVGIRLVSMHHIKDLAKHRELPVYTVTALGVTFFGLLTGVGVGLALSFIILLRRMSHANIRMSRVDGRCNVVVDGALTFLTVPKLVQTLSEIPRGCDADIDLHVDFMDHAAFEALHDWEQGHLRGGDKVNIVEHREEWYEERQGDSPMVRKAPFDLNLSPSGPQKAEAAH
jgi:carbonic anhydrase